MAKKYFGLYKKDKKCPSCKGPFYNPRNHTTSICEMCESKMCSVCGKISIHGVRASTDGFPFCPKHWSSFLRFKDGALNKLWSTDRELQIWLDNRGKVLSERLGLAVGKELESDLNQSISGSDINPESSRATAARESAIDKMAQMLIDGITIPGTIDPDTDDE